MTALSLGYTTYAMPDEAPFDALERLREIGYESIELTVSEGWPTSPYRLDGDDRDRLREHLRDLGFPPPHLMDLTVEPCATGEARAESLGRFDATCALASDLHFGDGDPIVKMPITGEQPEWEGNEEQIRDDLLELADVAAEHGVVFAAEPHEGTCFETPEKGAWLMATTDHPNLRLALDISHFPEELFDVEEAVELCAPHAVTTHVKDTQVVDGEFRFLLPGETDFDYETYLELLVDHGYRGPIIAEVSAQIWRDGEDYDAWAAAEFMYEALRGPIDAANRYAEGDADSSDRA